MYSFWSDGIRTVAENSGGGDDGGRAAYRRRNCKNDGNEGVRTRFIANKP